MEDTTALPGLGPLIGFALIFGLVFYVYFCAALTVIARKTGTPGRWMAWIPILNIYLMCRIAGRPGWWLLLLLIPLLNFIVGVVVWVDMAKARGKPGWTGVLILVPLINFFMPAYLAMGQATRPAPVPGTRQPAASSAAPIAPPTPEAPTACPGCGASVVPGDAFCGECGQPVPKVPAIPPPPPGTVPSPPADAVPSEPASSGSRAMRVVLVVAVVIVIGIVAAGYVGYRGVAGMASSDRIPAQLPQRMAGTLSEFPVDTDTNMPAVPESTITQNLENGAGGPAEVRVPQSWLPPGMNPQSLPGQATAVSSAVYRTRPEEPPVNVHVLTTRPGSSNARTIAGQIARNTGGETTQARVESPQGSVYTGYKVQTAQLLVFVLARELANALIVIYAPEPAAMPVATRLAGNVGNGQGLIDYPQLTRSLWVLPPTPPPGLELEEMNTVTPEDLGLTQQGEGSLLGGEVDEQIGELIEQVSFLIPERITLARYSDESRQPWNVLVGEYPSRWRAWTVWVALRGVAGIGDLETVSVAGVTGITGQEEDGQVLVFQKGRHILAMQVPSSSPVDRLLEVANAFQM